MSICELYENGEADNTCKYHETCMNAIDGIDLIFNSVFSEPDLIQVVFRGDKYVCKHHREDPRFNLVGKLKVHF